MLTTLAGPYLEFADKDPAEVNEYFVDFTALITDGSEISDLAVTLEPGNGESPVVLEVVDAQAEAVVGAGSPSPATVAHFWLRSGTNKVRYRWTIQGTVDGAGSPAPNVVMVKRFYVVVSQ